MQWWSQSNAHWHLRHGGCGTHHECNISYSSTRQTFILARLK
uniref:Uncharacterized protein n=1 Tax=Rhizophora mucronata TaxID=61149 RepID=A0A2P2JDW1_RHIMU